jgi:hypothetical protein
VVFLGAASLEAGAAGTVAVVDADNEAVIPRFSPAQFYVLG